MKPNKVRNALLIILSLLVFLLSAFTLVKVVINHGYVEAYNAGNYDTSLEEKLKILNFPQGYLPYYNLGNAAYQRGDYIEAIGLYSQALEQYPPQGKDCDIRVNQALSLCNTIDFNNIKSQAKLEEALTTLYTARDILMENGCANDEGTGHDPEAQQLKDDIDRMIQALQNPQEPEPPQNGGGENDQDQNNDQNNSQSMRERQQQDQLQDNKEQAMEERQRQQSGGGPGGSQSGAGGHKVEKPW